LSSLAIKCNFLLLKNSPASGEFLGYNIQISFPFPALFIAAIAPSHLGLSMLLRFALIVIGVLRFW
jgi:hypothetical protein